MVSEMKVSLICTVKNEEDNIRQFMNSIIHQTRKPDEFIIVDGGSTDNTYNILKEYAKKYKWIKVYQVKGANISEGRNYAIKRSKYDIIAVCDAGTKYKKDWLEKLVAGFNGQVSFGIDKPLAKTKFQKILGRKLCHKFKEGSSRNMIFLKKIWEEVGGYPEDLFIGEDSVFDEKIKRKGYKISIVKDAVCYWQMRKNIKELKKQFYNYGFWDGVAYKKYRMLPLKHKIAIILLTLMFPLFLPLFFISRFSLSLKIEFVRRFYYLIGFWRGLLTIQ